MKTGIIVLLLVFLCMGVFAQQTLQPEESYLFRINNNEELDGAFEIIKECIADNNHYHIRMAAKSDALGPEDTVLAIIIFQKMEVQNFTMKRLLFYMNGARIDITLSDNEIFGYTQPYSQSERYKVFDRFNQLYRWNVLGDRSQ